MKDSLPTNQPGYFQTYIDQVKENDLETAFLNQSEMIKNFLPSITEEQSKYAYQEGKWTLRELLQHIIDTERILSYRALCFSRKESASLPGFDENEYAAASNGNNRTWESLTAEFDAVRRSTLFLFNSFTPEMLTISGIANGNPISVESLGFTLIGHFYHHKKIIEERYI
jgi:hypothetical protein